MKFNRFFGMAGSVKCLLRQKPTFNHQFQYMLFTQDSEVQRYAVVCLWILCFGYIFFAYGMRVSH